MIKKLHSRLILTISILCFVLAQSCQEEVFIDFNYPEVKISIHEAYNPELVKVNFLPNEEVSHYTYYISNNEKIDSTEVIGNEATLAEFENLKKDENYTISVRGYNKLGESTYNETALHFNASINIEYILSNSAAFRINYDNKFVSARYFVGTAEDREYFIRDAVESQTLGEVFEFAVIDFYELNSETEYILFFMAYNREGESAGLIEVPFKTLSLDDSPSVKLETPERDSYITKYVVTQNEKVGKIECLILERGQFDSEIHLQTSWAGDLSSMIETWADPELGFAYRSEQGPLSINLIDNMVRTKAEKEIYVLMYDKDGNKLGIQKFDYAYDLYDEKKGIPSIDISINEINTSTVNYDVKIDDNTMLVQYEIFGGDWYESSLLTDPNFDEFFVGELMFYSFRSAMVYYKDAKNGVMNITDDGLRAGEHYYVAVSAINSNGPTIGLAATKIIKIETPAE